MSDKLKITNKYLFEVVDSDVMKERMVSTNNVVLRIIQRNERTKLPNIVKNGRIDRNRSRIKPTKVFVLVNPSISDEVENGAIIGSGFHENDIISACNGNEFFDNGRRSSRNVNKFDVASINGNIMKPSS